MKKDALLSFKCTPEMKTAVERLAKEGDRSIGMQLTKIVREWLEEHDQPPSAPHKPQKTGRS
jgi:hypothetical protein